MKVVYLAGIASFSAIVALASYCGLLTGRAEGYCEGKYGPSVEVVWTGTLGITGECELEPAIPAKRVVVP